ncbi:PREDICTED: trans-Golgi network integral membrane protein 2-like [Polistes canadensis]|uniref:trans-Golgi network integral membrane protein 2-like n=1 Tax=Polistes canadensis TaxID=91411 RepID=UPI000718C082|nr:PREDICTED: trans-Golgi network integral membrane protein 2-like [Polistes canadensis]
MEDSFRIIYALCIIFIRFPLYYLAPVQNNFNMYNDTNLCNTSIKDFLYKSEYTKECNSFKYHEELGKHSVTLDNAKEFLCLGIYDTAYKLCQYEEIERWDKIFPDQKQFDLKIGDLVKIYQTNGSTTNSINFCNDLIGYTPKYDKLKPILSKLMAKFETPQLCFSICFDLESKLRTPLCAILAWINKIDQDITEKLKNDSNKVNGVDKKNESLKNKQENHKDQQIMQHETADNRKHLENKRKENKITENKIHNSETSAASIISINNVKKDNITNNSNNNKQLPLSKENRTKTSDESNLIKSDPTIKTTLQSTFNTVINKNNESQDKLTALLNEADKKLVDDNNNSQEPPPNLEEDDSKSIKKDKVDPEKDSITEKYVTQAVTETKSTEAFDNAKIISTTESIVAVDNNLSGSDPQKNVPTEGISQPGSVDNPSESISEPSKQRAHFENDEESHFLFYFAVISIGFIGGYTGYHNKKKLLAIVLKGRRSKNNRGRRRSSSPKYRKLDCTLEEAVTSQCNANVTHVIY